MIDRTSNRWCSAAKKKERKVHSWVFYDLLTWWKTFASRFLSSLEITQTKMDLPANVQRAGRESKSVQNVRNPLAEDISGRTFFRIRCRSSLFTYLPLWKTNSKLTFDSLLFGWRSCLTSPKIKEKVSRVKKRKIFRHNNKLIRKFFFFFSFVTFWVGRSACEKLIEFLLSVGLLLGCVCLS